MSNPLPGDPKTHGLREIDEQEPQVSSPHGGAPQWEDPEAATPTGEHPLQEPLLNHLPVEESGTAGREAMIDTAERIGTAMGNVQRRTLQLVRRPSQMLEFPPAHDVAESASRMVREIEEQAATVRHEAARKFDDLSTQAEEKYGEFTSVVRTRFSRALQLADSHPLQTIAAFAAAGFVLGVALRFRRPHRG
jgi:ElaB/YqjD/DUF883 family membrane-anchored ribosome-binding protein